MELNSLELNSPLVALLQEAEKFLREAEQEVLNRREKVGGAPQSPAHPPTGGRTVPKRGEQEVLNRREKLGVAQQSPARPSTGVGAVPQGAGTGSPEQERKGGWSSIVPCSPSNWRRSSSSGRRTRKSSTGEKRWVELNSSLLNLQLEAEQFLREAEQEVLNRREKVGGAPESMRSPSYRRRAVSKGRRNRRSSPGEKRWVELHSPLLALLLEAEQFLREAEQEVLNRREKVG